MAKLEKPRGLKITFKPSERQYELWKALQPGLCECGGKLEMRPYGFDSKGHQTYKATCTKCGTTDIPEQVLGGGSAGGGKGMLLDAQVLTPNGFKRVRDLHVGSIISNPITGGEQNIIYLHPIEKRDYYRVYFADDTWFDCTDNHLWVCGKIKTGGEQDLNLTTWVTKNMYEWYQRRQKNEALYIPVTKPIHFEERSQELIILPYIVGVIIGFYNEPYYRDIYNSSQCIGKECEKFERLKELGFDSKDIASLLGIAETVISMSDEEFKEYLFSSIHNRKEVIRGFFDMSADIIQDGGIAFSTFSSELANNIAFIIRSLGGIVKIKANEIKLQGSKEVEIVYDVRAYIRMPHDLFRNPRKKEEATSIQNNKFNLGKQITNIVYLGEKEGRCITVSDPSGLYCVDNFTVTHNSYLGCAWLILSCMQFEGIRMAVARKERSALINSTWRTLNDVLNQWGLKRDVNYHVDNLRYAITFWNGSEILALHLAPSPGDPNYENLGSLEITGSFIDEVSEVPEKAVEILSSRIRYKVDETFVVGKNFMSCNPSLGWVRDTFVMNENHEPVVLPPGYRYIPFSLFDNPNEKFRAIYYNRLSKLRNKADRDRLLYGNWLFTEKNTLAAYWNFDGDKHLVQNLKETYYDPLRPLILSWDFNGSPYMSCLPLQIDFENKKVYIFPEYVGYPKDKLNNTPDMSKWVAGQLIKQGHVGGVLITGDPAGLARSTQTEEGTNNYTIINKNMANTILRPKIQLLNKQPSHVTRLEFVNELLNGYQGWEIKIDARCHKLVEDFSYQKKNPDGTKEKKKVLNDAGVRVEKWGHFSDCFDYALVYYLNKEYSAYRTASTDIVTTVENGEIVYGEFDY